MTWVNPVGVTQTFVQDTEDHNVNYNVTTQAYESLRVRFAGSNQRTIGAPAFPVIEPDGTSRSTFANFQGDRLFNKRFNNAYSGDRRLGPRQQAIRERRRPACLRYGSARRGASRHQAASPVHRFEYLYRDARFDLLSVP